MDKMLWELIEEDRDVMCISMGDVVGASRALTKILDSMKTQGIRVGRVMAQQIRLIALYGGWNAFCLRPDSLGCLIASEEIVVYKGMVYSRDVWE
jgi:hypothetical protein